MYKDKDKQREANRQASQRQRDKKGMTDDCAKAGIVIPDHPVPVIPERTAQGNIRVSKPGDSDYETTLVNAEPNTGDKRLKDYYDKHREEGLPKRGKDIKCFTDLPPDVQQTINKMSLVDGKIDHVDKAKRTAAAIKYQHLFPDRYNSTGVR